MAAAAGDITGWPLGRFTHQSRIRALVFAADHQRLDVIDQLVEAGTPVNQADAEWERLPLHTAAGNGRAASVRRLLAQGADPNLRDPTYHRTPLEECQKGASPGHREVEGHPPAPHPGRRHAATVARRFLNARTQTAQEKRLPLGSLPKTLQKYRARLAVVSRLN